MEIKLYNRKTFTIEAIRVTDENMAEVAAWCRGSVEVERTDSGVKKYIHVKVRNPINEKQSKAFAGDWVMRSKHGFKVYINKAFTNSFEEQPGQAKDTAEVAIDRAEQVTPTAASKHAYVAAVGDAHLRPKVVTEAQALANLGARDQAHAEEIKQRLRDDPPTNERPWRDQEIELKGVDLPGETELKLGPDKPFFEQKAEIDAIVDEANKPIELTKEEQMLKNIFEAPEPSLCEACLLEKPVKQTSDELAMLCDDCRPVYEEHNAAREDVVKTLSGPGLTEKSAREALGFSAPPKLGEN